MQIQFPAYYNSSVGSITLYRISWFTSVIESFVTSVINVIFGNGIPVNSIVEYITGSKVVQFTELNIINGESFMVLKLTPIFTLTPEAL